MPAVTSNTDYQSPIVPAWIVYTDKVKLLLVPRKDDRPLDQYLTLRDEVFKIIQSQKFLDDLDKAFPPNPDQKVLPLEITKMLVLELESASRAIEVAKAMENPKKKEKWWDRWGNKLLVHASTVTGSVKDIGENLPQYAKNGLTLFNEVIDFFKS